MTDRTQKGVPAGRILIVDDEKAICEVIAAMLVSANYESREAASGVEALAVLESGEEFDLVLSDLMMPDLDGIGLLERSKDKYPDMPVVIVTAVCDISVALATIRRGAQDYLMKPFEREQLLAVVRRALEYRRAMLDHRAYVSGLESQVASLTEQLRGRKS
jgi:DNA-binding NtrC family response regulator